MPYDQGAGMLAWCAFLLVFLRYAGICSLLFVSVNWHLFMRCTIQVQPSGSKAAPTTTRKRKSVANQNECGGKSTASDRKRDLPNTPQPGRDQTAKLSTIDANQRKHAPPPYSFTPPESHEKLTSSTSIVILYEDIIASDSQTIQTQQETMQAQQETIRAQAQMIRKLRLVLEEQDLRIEELETMVGRLKGSGEGGWAEKEKS